VRFSTRTNVTLNASPYTQLDAFGNDGGVTKLSEGGC
jgi:hypothetical protein